MGHMRGSGKTTFMGVEVGGPVYYLLQSLSLSSNQVHDKMLLHRHDYHFTVYLPHATVAPGLGGKSQWACRKFF